MLSREVRKTDEPNRTNIPDLSYFAPVGFGSAIYENERAMRSYSMLSEAEKERVRDDLRGMGSYREARKYARALGEAGLRN